MRQGHEKDKKLPKISGRKVQYATIRGKKDLFDICIALEER